MKSISESPPDVSKKLIQSLIAKKTIIFITQILFMVTLLIIWLSNESIRETKNLWILFFYNIPSQFLISILPQEPIVLYYSKYYSPLTIALVSIAGTIIVESINYSTFKFISELKPIEKFRNNKFLNKIIDLFNYKPFLAIFIAGLTPVPFYPFRFLAVWTHYAVYKYLLAVFLSRTPRFFILAIIGYSLKLPNYLLILIFLVFIILPYLPLFKRRKIVNASLKRESLK